jgi:integrase
MSMEVSEYVSMASIHKRPGSRYWHAFFRDSEGILKDRSTRLKDRKQAQKVADLFEMTAQRQKNALHVRASFALLFQESYQETMAIATVREFGKTWLAMKGGETSPGTMESYRKTIQTFVAFLGPKADRDLAEVTRNDLIGFRNQLAESLSPASVNRYIQTLRMMFKSAEKDKLLLEDPSKFVELVKNKKSGEKRTFTLPEIQAVLSVADPEWQSLVKFGLYTGQRLGDLAMLTWANVDLERGELRLTTQKTDRRVTIPLGEALAAHLMTLQASDRADDPIHPRAFASVSKLKRTVTLSHHFIVLLEQAGLRGKGAESGLSFHSLRHTAVSLLKDAGVPQATVMELIGHDSEEMSARYTHVGRESLLKAANALPRI